VGVAIELARGFQRLWYRGPRKKPMLPTLDPKRAQAFVDEQFSASIVETLERYIEIPNKSPMFDPKWREHGHMDAAVRLVADWCRDHLPSRALLEVIGLPDRTPLIFIDVPGTEGAPPEQTVLLYGHLDKQPEMTGWAEGLGPWTPVLREDKLYGRGGADDGYSAFASLTALAAIDEQGVPRPRCVILIEACEESGSVDLPAYIDHLEDRIGTPTLVVCLDSGCGNYDQLWCTTSLRGNITCTLRVEVLREGVHSGDASGVVASSFRIARMLLSRIEDPQTGELLGEEFAAEIPQERVAQAQAVAEVIGDEIYSKFPLQSGMQPTSPDPTTLILARTWRATLSIVGADGLPPIASAGNVLRPFTALKLSVRLPPTIDAKVAAVALRQRLEADPPYDAHVQIENLEGASGWNAPPLSPKLEALLQEASQTYFGAPAMAMGEGGSIPFMGMLGKKFPRAEFVVTGVLGPLSNAHGPNEFLHLPTARRLTASIATIIAGLAAP